MSEVAKHEGLRVAIVAPFPPPYGGMSLQAQKLVSRLRGEGISVEMIATNPSPPALFRFVQSIPGVRTAFRIVRYLWSLLRHAGGRTVWHHLGASGLYFFVHTTPLVLLGRSSGHFVVLNYRGGNAARFLNRWGWVAVPIMKLSDVIAVPSPFLQKIFASHGMKALLLPNLADTERFPYKQRHVFQPRLIVTRNLEPMYNVECVLRTFRIVQHRFPEAVLSVVGSGSEEQRLRALAREWSLSGVTFHGAVPNEQLPELYAEHDIFINASNVDNFPGALVEAACSGLPIVSTKAGGIPEMIRDGENGLLTGLNDARGLADRVIECIDDPQLATNLARAARNWAEQFSWASVFPALLDCYGVLRAAAALVCANAI